MCCCFRRCAREMTSASVRLEPTWRQRLGGEFDEPYMQDLRAFLAEEKSRRKVIYPKGREMFAAMDLCPFDAVKVVIIGQDPYHGPGQAHGLCFSVREGVQQPPSLVNIFQEIEQDIGGGERQMPRDRGCLTPWAAQGVLLLNAVLTVERGQAGSHQGRGWERFTDQVVRHLNDSREGVVFMLWGAYAQKKGAIVDRSRHCVLTAPHPSPLSAHRGFFGCRHFSRANAYLESRGEAPVDWFHVA